jgi:hypothetical protein
LMGIAALYPSYTIYGSCLRQPGSSCFGRLKASW